MIKNYDICRRCPSFRVPTSFSPCRGCSGNMDSLVQPATHDILTIDSEKSKDNAEDTNNLN